MNARTAVVVAAVVALAGAAALAWSLQDVPSPPEEAGGGGGVVAEDFTAFYGRSAGAAGLVLEADARPDEGVVVLAFTLHDAAGEATSWTEVVDLETRTVLETDRDVLAPAYAADEGDATWVLVPRDLEAGEDVRVLDRALEAVPGEEADPPVADAWVLCEEGEAACYVYDRATGLYLERRDPEEPTWVLFESTLLPEG